MSEARLERTGAGRYRISGFLTYERVPEVYEAARSLFEEGVEWVVDLGGVERADSAGLALLVDWVRQARERNVRVRFERVSERLRHLAALGGVEGLLPLGDTAGGR